MESGLEVSRREPTKEGKELMHLSRVEVEKTVDRIPVLCVELSELEGEHAIVAQKCHPKVDRTRFDLPREQTSSSHRGTDCLFQAF